MYNTLGWEGYLNSFKRHHHWRFQANRWYQWRFQTHKSNWRFPAAVSLHCNTASLGLAFTNSPTLLAFSYKSGSAAGNGVSIAMCQTPAEGAINNGISHAGYVQKEHPLGNRSRTALVREILSKRTPNREMCRVIASTIISRVFSRVSAYLFYFIKKSYIEFQLFKCVVGCP